MGAKMNIMEYDARRQMEIKAREAFFTTVFQKRAVAPHLLLKVRRECIIEDSLTQISCNEMDVKKGLRIEFVGEDGVDAGGLRKEWFLLLCREVFDPLYGTFPSWGRLADEKGCLRGMKTPIIVGLMPIRLRLRISISLLVLS